MLDPYDQTDWFYRTLWGDSMKIPPTLNKIHIDTGLHMPTKEDTVNSPKHHVMGGIETIDFIKAKLSPEEYKGYLKGNIFKYISRAPYKQKEEEDYAKAKWYLDRLNATK